MESVEIHEKYTKISAELGCMNLFYETAATKGPKKLKRGLEFTAGFKWLINLEKNIKTDVWV